MSFALTDALKMLINWNLDLLRSDTLFNSVLIEIDERKQVSIRESQNIEKNERHGRNRNGHQRDEVNELIRVYQVPHRTGLTICWKRTGNEESQN